MGFKQGAYARIWSVNDDGKYTTANMSISKKSKDSDTYVVDFKDGFVQLCFDAREKAKTLGLPTREQLNAAREQFNASGGKGKVDTPDELKGVSIQITSCDVTNNYDVKTRKNYNNFKVYDFVISDRDSNDESYAEDSRRSAAASTNPKHGSRGSTLTEVNDDELPF